MRIDADYSAVHRLSDGGEVRIRLLRPSDRDRLAAGFRRLSPQSRYRRFFSPMPKLSERLLRRLMETDDWNHLAILAEPVAQNDAQAVGVARFFRLEETPDVAEASVAVIDDMQRRGLGRLLLTTLVEAARERGIRRFRAYVLPDNEPVKRLLRSLGEHSTAHIQDGLRVYDLTLPEPSPEAVSSDPIYRFFKLVAEGVGTTIRSLGIPFKRRARRRPRAQPDKDTQG